ncbi:MAG: DUF1624 domain-containing protein [Prevotella sp.]|nr:DUF1624 domain-containing protein [Prevotella sp.]
MKSNSRLISLDVFRGMTVMLMIFVNNGAGEEIFSTLQHSKWNGMTPCDLVFPFFLFMMGMSTYLSLKKTGFAWSRQTGWKIARRALLLFLIGLAINWLDMACSGRPLDLAHLRIMGVMQRIGLCYAATALAAIVSTRLSGSLHPVAWAAGVLLAIYAAIVVMGGGYDYDASTNILSIVDHRLLGEAHLYHKSPVDPEGLVSTLSAIAHTMIGLWVASWALARKSGAATLSTLERFLLSGAALTFAGYLLTFALPLNKRIWSPSYVLMTCGFAALLQGLLIAIIDRPGVSSSGATAPPSAVTSGVASPVGTKSGWVTALCLIFGTNPLFLYVASEVLSIVFGSTGVKDAVYQGLHAVITNGYWASVGYATLFVLLHALMGYPLWKRHIYIKI